MPSSTLTRRALLVGAGTTAACAAIAVPYANAVQSAEMGGAAVDPSARYEAALAEFKAAAEALYPDLGTWIVSCGDAGVIACAGRPIYFTGFGVYEVEFAGRTGRPIVALAGSESGDGYFWQRYWVHQDRFEGQPEFISSDKLTIKHKIKSLA